MKERIPDKVLEEADEVVNIDLTAEELINRLKAGKIYKTEKIQTALSNFFKTENILQLRELALKEVAFRVEKKVETYFCNVTKDVCAVWALCMALPCRSTNKLPDKTTCKGEKGKTKLCTISQYILCRSRACFRTRHWRRGVFGTYIPHKNKHTSCTEENYEQNA